MLHHDLTIGVDESNHVAVVPPDVDVVSPVQLGLCCLTVTGRYSYRLPGFEDELARKRKWRKAAIDLSALSITELVSGKVDGLIGSVLEDNRLFLGRDIRNGHVDDIDSISNGLRVVDRVPGISGGACTSCKTDEKHHGDHEDRSVHNRCIRAEWMSVPSVKINEQE
nr:hypothetical protein [Natronoarchaeum rubrum]